MLGRCSVISNVIRLESKELAVTAVHKHYAKGVVIRDK